MKKFGWAKAQEVTGVIFMGALALLSLGIFILSMLLDDPWTPMHAWVADYVDAPMILVGGSITLLTGIISVIVWTALHQEIIKPLLTYRYWQVKWWTVLDADYLASLDYNDDLPPMSCQMILALMFLVGFPLCFQYTRVLGEVTLGIWIAVTIFLTVEGHRHKRDWLRRYRAGEIVYD